mmetsp:Transcript_69216/g.212222  ORF Transcript_69216/g.212222 Transcript_69216/m.212222 type:complete len:381 (-) Transcript_69216:559-1701(-)
MSSSKRTARTPSSKSSLTSIGSSVWPCSNPQTEKGYAAVSSPLASHSLDPKLLGTEANLRTAGGWMAPSSGQSTNVFFTRYASRGSSGTSPRRGSVPSPVPSSLLMSVSLKLLAVEPSRVLTRPRSANGSWQARPAQTSFFQPSTAVLGESAICHNGAHGEGAGSANGHCCNPTQMQKPARSSTASCVHASPLEAPSPTALGDREGCSNPQKGAALEPVATRGGCSTSFKGVWPGNPTGDASGMAAVSPSEHGGCSSLRIESFPGRSATTVRISRKQGSSSKFCILAWPRAVSLSSRWKRSLNRRLMLEVEMAPGRELLSNSHKPARASSSEATRCSVRSMGCWASAKERFAYSSEKRKGTKPPDRLYPRSILSMDNFTM